MLLASTAFSAGAQSTHLLIISGIGGEEKYSKEFYESAVTMMDAAVGRCGLPAANVTYLAEEPKRDPKRIAGQSTKVNVEQALARLAERAGANDQIVILLIGHGSSQGEESRFNLPGPDMTEADFAKALAKFGSRRVAFINASSASGSFLPVLSAPNRVIITATKTGLERNESQFAHFFVQAFASDGADVDKDGRVSLLEAFNYARREVERAYEQSNKLLTEHAQLDDNGDHVGTPTPDGKNGEGALARTFFLGGGTTVAAAGGSRSGGGAAPLTPEIQALVAQLDALKQQKAKMAADAYDKELERLLLDIATKSHAARAAAGQGKP